MYRLFCSFVFCSRVHDVPGTQNSIFSSVERFVCGFINAFAFRSWHFLLERYFFSIGCLLAVDPLAVMFNSRHRLSLFSSSRLRPSFLLLQRIKSLYSDVCYSGETAKAQNYPKVNLYFFFFVRQN
jgi:hypothetical protein